MARRKRNDAPAIDTGPSAVEVELARQWVAAGHFLKVQDYSRPLAERELEAEAQEMAGRFHRMAAQW